MYTRSINLIAASARLIRYYIRFLSASGACSSITMPSTYVFVSLPARIFDDDPIDSLRATIGPDNGNVVPFVVPSFKIGTLDALVQQADDLTKLNHGCEAVISKVSDSLKSILDGDETKSAEHKTVNDSKPLRSRPEISLSHIEEASS